MTLTTDFKFVVRVLTAFYYAVLTDVGYGQDFDRQQSQDAGFDYHLVKPVEAQELEALVAKLTKEQRSASED